MEAIKCKMCGGTLQIIQGQSYGVCEFCGTTMTVPKTVDDRILNLFNRANDYRLQNEFDKALAAYESILNEDNANAEAHWGCVLSKYGIEYVEDPLSLARIPTCHRVQHTAILADLDYKKALEYADESARALYEKEAAQISDIQKRILDIAREEEAYDVFICYKETDENGKRTRDSVFAQDIYFQLVDEGYKVFFARITLEEKLGREYEPYIFAALNTAKVMLVIGTKPEYYNAVWVRNEWSRFLALLKTDRTRLLIPCYRDMDPYDLPEELSLFQSQDMGRIGFLQDLIRGIKKIVPRNTPSVIPQAAPISPPPVPQSTPTPVQEPKWEPAVEPPKPTPTPSETVVLFPKNQNTVVTNAHSEPTAPTEAKDKPRRGMKFWKNLFLFFVTIAVINLLTGSSPIMEAISMALSFGILALMFWILSLSPKKSPYLFGKKKGMKKKTFVTLCLIAFFAIMAIIGSSDEQAEPNPDDTPTQTQETLSTENE